MIEGVTIDGGAFNVREGNHSVDLAATYVPRQRFNDFVQVTGDYRDIDLMAGWSPAESANRCMDRGGVFFREWILGSIRTPATIQGEWTARVQTREQSVDAIRNWLFRLLICAGSNSDQLPVPGDTIDNRQSDTTHNLLVVATDNWKLSEQKQFSFSSFFRNYALQLRSNFGGGLIQQSETRDVVGGEASYIQSVRPWIAVLAGMDLRRDAPRNLDLMHIDDNGIFQPVTRNNLTLSFVEPFVSLDGTASRYIHFDIGVRQEEVWMDNQDLINPQNSFDRLASLSLPKATLTFLPPDSPYLPTVAFSYGEAFHTEDPRIGNGTGQPTLLAPSRAYQLRVSKVVKQTQFNLTLRRTSNSQELAKIDPDTGLQEDTGPSLNRAIAVSVQRNFSRGAIYISYAQADARDTQTGQPVPEAPRMIWDAVASEDHLPFHLQLRGEFEFVRAKPLGDGFVGEPVTEVRGAILRPFLENRMSLGANFLIVHGYTGQTTETIPFQPAPCPIECVVGVPLKSYVSLSWTYYFNK